MVDSVIQLWEDQYAKDNEGLKCYKLWCAVVAAAVMDTCLHPVTFRHADTRAKQLMNLNPQVATSKKIPRKDAMSALYFLFEKDRADHILDILDIDPGHFRKSLVACMYGYKYGKGVTSFTSLITDSHRIGFRFNYAWWLANQQLVNNYVMSHINNEKDDD